MKYKLIIALFTICCLTSCKSVPKRSKLLNDVKNGYSITLNSKPINIDKLYFDNHNIEKIIRDSKSKTIDLVQKNPVDIGYLSDMQNVKALNESKYNLIVIDGTPIEPEDFDNVKLEISAIETISILKNDSLAHTMCRVTGDVLLIRTNAR